MEFIFPFCKAWDKSVDCSIIDDEKYLNCHHCTCTTYNILTLAMFYNNDALDNEVEVVTV